jgi:hypothetical protein
LADGVAGEEQRQGRQERRDQAAEPNPQPGAGVELVQISTSKPS